MSYLPECFVPATSPEPVPAIYLLINNGVVIYVGQTVNVRQRLKSHSLSCRNDCGISKVEWDSAFYTAAPLSAKERKVIEQALILRFKPRFNSPRGMGLFGTALAKKLAEWREVDELRRPRLILYLTPEEMKAAKALAAKNGFRTPQQWAVSVIVRALIIK